MSPEILFISDIQAILEPLTLPRDSTVHHRMEKLEPLRDESAKHRDIKQAYSEAGVRVLM